MPETASIHDSARSAFFGARSLRPSFRLFLLKQRGTEDTEFSFARHLCDLCASVFQILLCRVCRQKGGQSKTQPLRTKYLHIGWRLAYSGNVPKIAFLRSLSLCLWDSVRMNVAEFDVTALLPAIASRQLVLS